MAVISFNSWYKFMYHVALSNLVLMHKTSFGKHFPISSCVLCLWATVPLNSPSLSPPPKWILPVTGNGMCHNCLPHNDVLLTIMMWIPGIEATLGFTNKQLISGQRFFSQNPKLLHKEAHGLPDFTSDSEMILLTMKPAVLHQLLGLNGCFN